MCKQIKENEVIEDLSLVLENRLDIFHSKMLLHIANQFISFRDSDLTAREKCIVDLLINNGYLLRDKDGQFDLSHTKTLLGIAEHFIGLTTAQLNCKELDIANILVYSSILFWDESLILRLSQVIVTSVNADDNVIKFQLSV